MDLGKRPFLDGHRARIVPSGESYFQELVQLIASAQIRLHLQVYIFEFDATGKRIVEALRAAANRGVEVFVLVDGFGSYGFQRAAGNELSGMHVRFFARLPLQTLRQPARRLHVKACVADGKCALVGGINISDNYRGSNAVLPWLDYALYFEGPVCVQLEHDCSRRFSKKIIPLNNLQVQDSGMRLRLSTNDWPRGRREISATYRRMFRSAQRSIIIVNSYFLPSYRTMRAIRRASKRGCAVTLLVGAVSDVPLAKAATRHLYKRLLKSGVQIFEYRPAVLHAKVCLVDGQWLNLGSYNLNHLSEFFSVEMNVEVLDKALAEQALSMLDPILAHESDKITAKMSGGFLGFSMHLWDALAYRILRSTRFLFILIGRRPPQAVF